MEITKSDKYRVTKQRNVILDVVKDSCDHPTASQIADKVALKDASIGQATVYRALEFLVANGYIIKIKTDSQEVRYDGLIDKHLHLICSKCGQIDDISYSNVNLDSTDLEESGFEPDFNYLQIYGVCKKCKLSHNQ